MKWSKDIHLKRKTAGADNLSSITISKSKERKKKLRKITPIPATAAVTVTMTMASSYDAFYCQDI